MKWHNKKQIKQQYNKHTKNRLDIQAVWTLMYKSYATNEIDSYIRLGELEGIAQMIFKYELTGRGWANGKIEVNSNEINFTTSFISDPLQDLLHSMISLIPECFPFPVKRSGFEWYDEPGGSTWKLERINNEQLSIDISTYEDISIKNKIEKHLYEVCKIDDFVKAVVKELENILKMHGTNDYKEEWGNHEFPINEFIILKEYIGKK